MWGPMGGERGPALSGEEVDSKVQTDPPDRAWLSLSHVVGSPGGRGRWKNAILDG